MEQLQSMWRMMARWLCFFSSRPTSVILTRYIIAPDLTTAPTLSVSAVARSWPVRGAKKKTRNAVDMFQSSWWRHHGILLQTLSSLSFFLWDKILPSHVERPPLAETGKASHCIADLPCCSHLFCLPTQLRCRLVICRGLIHKNLTGLQLYNMPA